jgi:Mg2+ and Co2+ transporter CorA
MRMRRLPRTPLGRFTDTSAAQPPPVDKGPSIGTLTHDKLTWVNIERPTREETQYLADRYPFHPLDLDDCLSKTQTPKIDKYEEYLFMVFHFPVFNPQARVTTASQVSIFVGEDYLITLHQGDLKPLVTLFRSCQTNEKVLQENMGHSAGYLLYRVLDRLVDYCFPILTKWEITSRQSRNGYSARGHGARYRTWPYSAGTSSRSGA